jgi:2-haloacid dehalogenase
MLDLSPSDAVFAEHTGDPHLRTRWFDLLIRATLATTAADEYRDFGQLGAASARAVTQADGKPLDDAAIAQLGAMMRALPAHPDTPAALTALRERGERVVALANSPQAVVDAQLRHAGIARCWTRSTRWNAPGFSSPHPRRAAGCCSPKPSTPSGRS